MAKIPKKISYGLMAFWLFAAVSLPILISRPGYAATTLQDRTLSIMSSLGGANTIHAFSFDFPVTVNVGSLQFQYCTDPIEDIPCDPPPGLDVSGAILDSQSGETGFSIYSTNATTIILTRPPANVGPQLNTYQFSNVINPTDIGPFFVRISAYPTTDASGAYSSFSSVAGSITQGLNINAEVPQILYFCSAVAIPTDCSDATGDFIEFGTLSSKGVKSGTSQFMVGTNAPNGYTVSTNGFTMTSGTNQINAIPAPDISRIGNSQFGLNLRANLAPPVGADPSPGVGIISASYNLPDKFNYSDGDIVEQALGRSEMQLFTVSYIVNVNSGQPAGIYNTTITYLCTAGF